MGSLVRFDLGKLARDFGCTVFVETGTGTGGGVLHAAQRAPFERLYTIELHEEVAKTARVALSVEPRIILLEGNSEDCLRKLLSELPADQPVLFWLDAHFPGADFGYASYDSERDEAKRLPLERELQVIQELRPDGRDVILVDDLRIYEDGPYKSGNIPETAQTLVPDRRHIRFVSELFDRTHYVHRLYHEEGYIVLLPRNGGAASDPYVLAGDSIPSIGAQEAQAAQGAKRVMYECGKAALRRLHQANFASRYFVGRGLDVGGGSDPLSLYTGLFPQITEVMDWDWEQGDAQYLATLPDNSFDFVHSSHCLEHLVDPAIGLANWLRVLKPGGYMVITIPDEDLYEQGVFPSRYNGDHKSTFTIWKERSWSDKSVNLVDLIRGLGAAVEVHKMELLDSSYRYDLPEQDQTMTAVGECAIELVLRKRPAVEIEAGGRLPGQTFTPSQQQRDEKLEEMTRQIEELTRQRDELTRSTSWKITAPLRWLKGSR